MPELKKCSNSVKDMFEYLGEFLWQCWIASKFGDMPERIGVAQRRAMLSNNTESVR